MQPTVQIDPDSWRAVESPEFAVRFGRLLAATRHRSNHSIELLAASSLGCFHASQLRQLEQGSSTIDESMVEDLCLLYSADLGRILPVRRPVAIADGRVSGAGVSVEFSHDDPASLLTAYLHLIRRMRNQKKAPAIALRRDDIVVLARHLDIDGAEVVERLSTLMNVSAAQRTTMGMLFATGAIVIGLAVGGHAFADGHASADVVTTLTDTSGTLDTSDTVEALTESGLVGAESQPDLTLDIQRLVDTGAAPAEPASSVTVPVSAPATARVALPVPVASPVPVIETATVAENSGIAEIATTIVERTPDQNVDHDRLSVPMSQPPAVIDAGSVPVIGGAADSVGLSIARRVQAPVAAPPSSVASEGPTPNQSGCNPDASAAVMSMVIPDIAYTCPVHAGGQAMIDAGFVTLVTAAGANPVLATRPGEPGTLWLAGHRTTNGAAFARVPDLADGALITVSSDDVTATYRVVGRSYVEVRGDRVIDAAGNATAEATWASIIRDDFSGNLAPRLVLQTCEGEYARWMIYADLVVGSS